MPAYIHGNATDKVFLIILHGGPGGVGWESRINTMITEVEKNNAVVYFDQRGSGNSEGNYSEEDLSIDLMAEDVLALAKVIKAKYGNDSKLFLMGFSWGGTLGPAVLLKDQSDFSGWINVDGSHDPKGEYNAYQARLNEIANEQIAIGNSVDYWTSVLDLVQNTAPQYNHQDYGTLNGAAGAAEERLMADGIINEPKFDEGDNTPSFNIPRAFWNSNITNSILTFKKEVYKNVSFTDRLSEITIPSLVLFGKYDIVVPVAFAQEAFDLLGSDDKEIFLFEKSGHGPLESEPDLFAEKVIEFINRLVM